MFVNIQNLVSAFIKLKPVKKEKSTSEYIV